MGTRARRLRGGVTAMLVAVSALGVHAHASESPVTVEVLSNRADLVSGGNALVAIGGGGDVVVEINGLDVSDAFALRPNGRYEGLVAGLADGANELTATRGDGSGARITITNRASHGPVLSGPLVQPWTCDDGTRGTCDREPTYTFTYMPSGGGAMRPYNPDNPPSDVAQVTTDNGETVPYIVRLETGVILRDQYRIAVLFDPSRPWEPWAPQRGFNHKLLITHGASCDTSYTMGNAPDVMNQTALARGFAVMSHALDNAGHNCNIITQGESLIMTKERVVETLGEIRYTIGTGCSGGSLVQQQLANAYPGLYQGILPQCSYPDAWSSAMQYEDYNLLRKYFEHPEKWAPGVVWEAASMAAVNGHPNPANPVTFTTAIPDSGEPSRSCPGVPAEEVYDEESNPDGVRCTLYDYMVNVFGRRENGFANVPWDNTGVLFGLRGLLTGRLTPEQFVDVNTKIGGFDIDHNLTVARTSADPFAVEAAYRSGAINTASNLDEVAIIDLRGPDPGAFHDVYRTYAVRARLEREHGTAANQALWRGFVPLIGDVNYVSQAIVAMDGWLSAVEADSSDRPLSEKIIANRNVVDRCTDGAGLELPSLVCDAVVQSYTTPRIEAGMPFTDDVMRCSLKPLQRSDYFPVLFTDGQWSRLQAAFPDGVCDYSRTGRGQVPTARWQTYQDSVGNVIYGGVQLEPPPHSEAIAG
jgi:hypothetical protein